jgi:hypothetical protein
MWKGPYIYGINLLGEMMKRGMIIDIDHMSEKSTDKALDLAEENDYPVVTSHSWFRDLPFSSDNEFDPQNELRYDTSDVHKVAHEAGKRGDQVERIAHLGRMVSAILNQGDLAGLRQGIPWLAEKIEAPSRESDATSTSTLMAWLITGCSLICSRTCVILALVPMTWRFSFALRMIMCKCGINVNKDHR